MSKIKMLREQQGWTVSEFARQLDVSRQTVYRIENGEVNPRDYLKRAIAKLLKTKVGYPFLMNAQRDTHKRGAK